MRVCNYRHWQRTKCQVALILFLTAIGFAGGLEQNDPSTAIPSPVGFIATMAALIWLVVNIIKTQDMT